MKMSNIFVKGVKINSFAQKYCAPYLLERERVREGGGRERESERERERERDLFIPKSLNAFSSGNYILV